MWSSGSAPASVSLDSRLRTPAGTGINGFTADMLQTVSLTQDEESDQANVSFWSHWGNCSDLPWKSGKNSDNNLIATSHYKSSQMFTFSCRPRCWRDDSLRSWWSPAPLSTQPSLSDVIFNSRRRHPPGQHWRWVECGQSQYKQCRTTCYSVTMLQCCKASCSAVLLTLTQTNLMLWKIFNFPIKLVKTSVRDERECF